MELHDLERDQCDLGDEHEDDALQKCKKDKKKRRSLLSPTTADSVFTKNDAEIDAIEIDIEVDIDAKVGTKLFSKKLLPSMFAWLILISASSAYFTFV